MLYGEKEIKNFNGETDFEIWDNQHKSKDYEIHVTLPEFTCLCPRSGYPDFATLHITYIPNEWVAELKALKIYINTFRDRHVSHENSANEIYDFLMNKLKPRMLKLTADFNPRGNVHTVITIDSTKQ